MKTKSQSSTGGVVRKRRAQAEPDEVAAPAETARKASRTRKVAAPVVEEAPEPKRRATRSKAASAKSTAAEIAALVEALSTPAPARAPRARTVRKAPAAAEAGPAVSERPVERPVVERAAPVVVAPAAPVAPRAVAEAPVAPPAAPVVVAPAPSSVSGDPAAPAGERHERRDRHDRQHDRRDKHERHDRRDRNGHRGHHDRHGRPGGAGNEGAEAPAGESAASMTPVTALDGSTVQAPGGAPQGQQPQPGQPGQPGSGRRRRRRRRGGGGGQPPGQHPGQQGQQHSHPQGQQHAQPHHHGVPESALQPVSGMLEVDDRGNGKLRRVDRNFQASDGDPDIPRHMIERYRLRAGWVVAAQAAPRNGRMIVHRVDQVEGLPPEQAVERIAFANLTSVDPDRRIQLETTGAEVLTRAIDLIAPVGFGQRGLIVAPPKTGKTIILQKMAKAILTNHPKARLMVLLIDERPEEVTDFRRSIGADVYGSSSDRPAHEHLRLAELVMERARRMCEAGEDVVVLLDSITRLARAYNKEIESSGRTMSGGVDSKALERPKRIFGAARNTEEAGSLTIIGTALVETGSRMDEVIFEEFKGTGNMELMLDRQLAERRLFPAININASGTRKEEKLFDQRENDKIRKLRQFLASQRPIDAMEKLLSRLRDFRSNAEFLDAM